MGIRKRGAAANVLQMPTLDAESKILHKCPLLREFITARQYEDNSDRTPGYITLRAGVTDFSVTLSDPDGAVRLTVRARRLDDLFAAVELALGAEDAPWEPDRYLMSQRPKSSKKKK